MSLKTAIIITGPTASGKTELAVELALRLNTSIISADSRQCFRELNIGVAKPTPAQLQQVKHYFINSHSIHEEMNAAIYETLALEYCKEVFTSCDHVVICGGTGLYIKAFCEGLDEIPAIDTTIRKQIIQQYEEKGMVWLQENIRSADPLFFDSGEIENPQRIMRALEVVKSTGRSILSFRNREKKQRPFKILIFGLSIPKNELYQRISHRVDLMMESGFLDEAASLIPDQHLNALQTVGYTELFDFIQGKNSYENSVSLIKQNTRHYAKRQMTWLKKNEKLEWLDQNFLEKILERNAYVRT